MTIRLGRALVFAMAVSGCAQAFSEIVQQDAQAGLKVRDREETVGGTSNAAVAALEKQVLATPGDIPLRSKLLRQYYLDRSPEARQARLGHILWLIRNAPEAEISGSPFAWLNRRHEPDAYEEARSQWLRTMQPSDVSPEVLFNAARFFMAFERSLATEIATRGAGLEPTTDRWQRFLDRIAALEAKQTGSPPQARQGRESADDAVPDTRYALERAAEEARRAGDDERARAYASELLNLASQGPRDSSYADAIHEGHRVLGHVALREGDVAGAREHLLKAGATPGSPTLDSFGPRLTLANELLKAGESAAVIEYLQNCSRFWKDRDGVIQDWIKRIRAGEKPELSRFIARRDR